MNKLLSILTIGVVFMSCAKEEKVAIISTKFGDMVVEFYDDVAPMHVESFKILADEGYFDGTTFHRVIPGFVIQGGDPNSKDEDRMNDGTGGRAGKFFGIGREEDSNSWTIPAEFNDKDHVKGTLSMARSSNPNSGSSQFFICHAATPQLNNQYTVFGQVIEGLDVIDQIVYSETPKKQNPGYRGPDGDNPFEKVEMKIKLSTKSEAIKK
ncbi:MAG: peptidylprolyl isomerase [Candidatus Marinimicrobia bacterium]|jgi:cyclophilin family peptidyl-prolyl cis-trans isomerase|nr:peptidylprolyl isomerase [Candidatus Neomarinimicrobiota bacterium]|tara:strand:- start:38 stop:667 length:630 start_codon:yes stop_codon:yes gene_type:complete